METVVEIEQKETVKVDSELKVPALRFPEFCGEWEEKRLKELLYEIKSRNNDFKFGKDDVLSVSGEYGIVNQILFLGRSYAGSSVESYHVVNKGNIVYTKSPLKDNPYGIIKVNKGEVGIVSTLYAVFGCKEQVSGEYIDCYFQLHDNTNKYLRPLVHKGAKNDMKISNDRFLSDSIFIPSIKEQITIVAYLNSIENRVRALERKKTLLEEYKKGVMQKIFSQQIRFKDDNGEDFPDWEEKRAKNIFRSHSNKNHNGDLPILSASQEKGMVYRDENNIQIQSSEKSVKSYKIVEKGDFVISLRSFQGGIEYSDVEGICSPAYTILKPKIKIEDKFFKFLFKKEDFIERLSKTVVGIRDGKQISYDAFSGLKIAFPTIKEQHKIANFLTNIDKKIEQTNKQLEKTKEFKKGLLQQMFVS